MSETPISPQGPEEPSKAPIDPTPVPPPSGFGGTAMPGVPDPADVEKNKMLAALSYVWLLWLVPLLAAKDSPYAKFHCNQGILLSICGFIGGCICGVGMAIPFLNFCFLCTVWPIFGITMLTFIILGVVNAINGRMKPLPLFPPIAWVK